jgi:hypothetical protein
MEPFSKLVFKVLIWIIATTIRIIADHCANYTHAVNFNKIESPDFLQDDFLWDNCIIVIVAYVNTCRSTIIYFFEPIQFAVELSLIL